MTQTYRNPENSWEVHNMLKDHPNRAQLIKRKWTEESLAEYLAKPKSLNDLIAEAGESENEEINSILLDMEAQGLVSAEPDGRIKVTGTKEQLLKFGIDPTDPSIFDKQVTPTSVASRVPNNPFGIKGLDGYPVPERHVEASQDMIDQYMQDYSRKGYSGDDLVVVHGAPGESPMIFPRDVLAKARAHGEHLVEFTEAETKAWRKKYGATASARFVLNYDDSDKTTMSVTKAALDEAWYRNTGMLRDTEGQISTLHREIGELDAKVAQAAGNLLDAVEDPETLGWTLAEITAHLQVEPERASEIIASMERAGHLEVFTRSTGEKAFRLNNVGAQAYEEAMEDFTENDPRFSNKQWFFDANDTRGNYR